jgi:hypothetical protein
MLATTETVVDLALTTYRLPFLESNATPRGPAATGIVAITVLVAPLITETVFEETLGTYRLPFLESNHTHT